MLAKIFWALFFLSSSLKFGMLSITYFIFFPSACFIAIYRAY